MKIEPTSKLAIPGARKTVWPYVHLLCHFRAFTLLLVLGVDGLLFLLDQLGLEREERSLNIRCCNRAGHNAPSR
jgi:hypothetical protein